MKQAEKDAKSRKENDLKEKKMRQKAEEDRQAGKRCLDLNRDCYQPAVSLLGRTLEMFDTPMLKGEEYAGMSASESESEDAGTE